MNAFNKLTETGFENSDNIINFPSSNLTDISEKEGFDYQYVLIGVYCLFILLFLISLIYAFSMRLYKACCMDPSRYSDEYDALNNKDPDSDDPDDGRRVGSSVFYDDIGGSENEMDDFMVEVHRSDSDDSIFVSVEVDDEEACRRSKEMPPVYEQPPNYSLPNCSGDESVSNTDMSVIIRKNDAG